MLFFTNCKESDTFDKPYLIREFRLKKFDFITTDLKKIDFTFKYSQDNELISILMNNEKIISYSKINDSLLELNYFWNSNNIRANAVLRVDVEGKRINRIYEYNKVSNEVKEIKFVYNYIDEVFNNAINYSQIYYISDVNQYDFNIESGNLTSYKTSYYYNDLLLGIRRNKEDTLYAEYSDTKFNKYIPFQNTLDFNLIIFKSGKYGAILNPLYILGINDFYCIKPNKNLVKNFEILDLLGGKQQLNYNYTYDVINDTITKIKSNNQNYYNLYWE